MPVVFGALQLRSTWCGSPVPLNATVMVEFIDALLVTVNWPVADPRTVGLNVKVSDIVWPGLSFAGRLTAETEKPLPETATEFTVTAAVPVDVSVTV